MPSASRPRRSLPRIVLTLLVIGAIIAALAYFGPGLLRSMQNGEGPFHVFSACTVEADERIGLDREEAQRAITAVALAARGLDTPDTSDIDDRVLDQLAEGPSEDAGPSLSCRAEPEPELPVQEPTETGLTPRAERVREVDHRVFGELPMGGFAPGGVEEGHMPGSAH